MSNLAIQDLMKKRGMSQADIAKAFGVSSGSVAMWISGENLISKKYLNCVNLLLEADPNCDPVVAVSIGLLRQKISVRIKKRTFDRGALIETVLQMLTDSVKNIDPRIAATRGFKDLFQAYESQALIDLTIEIQKILKERGEK